MNYGSVCSGIEAATVAWEPLGWNAAFYSEIEPFPCAVLQHHYPNTPNYGDMTKYKEWPDAAINVLVGGTPCQSFSVAGLRKGLADPRGNLMLIFGAIASKYRPTWLCWENVPGVLSSNGGRDFGTFLGMLGELGYGFAYRVFDAQFVRVESHRRAVPQRRRRVFVVGYLGDWRPAAAVLFERESLSWDSPPSRKAGEGVAGFTQVGVGVGGEDVSGCLRSNTGSGFRSDGSHVEGLAICMVTGQASAEIGIGTTLNCNRDGAPICFTQNDAARVQAAHSHGVFHDMQVRRLTPVECERLQGFPDNYTKIPWRNKPTDQCPDGPRYKALGNSMATNVMRHIVDRIELVNQLMEAT